MLALARWIDCCGWRKDARPKKRAARLAGPAKPFAGGDPAARHALRMAATRARCDTEFFQALYGSACLRPWRKVLAALQDELGRFNDAAVAARLLQELSAWNRDLEAPAEFVRGYLAAQMDAAERAVMKAWNKLAQLKLPV